MGKAVFCFFVAIGLVGVAVHAGPIVLQDVGDHGPTSCFSTGRNLASTANTWELAAGTEVASGSMDSAHFEGGNGRTPTFQLDDDGTAQLGGCSVDNTTVQHTFADPFNQLWLSIKSYDKYEGALILRNLQLDVADGTGDWHSYSLDDTVSASFMDVQTDYATALIADIPYELTSGFRLGGDVRTSRNNPAPKNDYTRFFIKGVSGSSPNAAPEAGVVVTFLAGGSGFFWFFCSSAAGKPRRGLARSAGGSAALTQYSSRD